MSIPKLAAVAALGLLFYSPRVDACGAPFGSGVTVQPAQDILVVHKGGSETYVFRATFCGPARDFGLILPIPSALSANPSLASTALFGELDGLTKPVVEQATYCLPPGAGGRDGGTRDATASVGDANVLAGGRVGLLDWVLLQADSTAAFTDWLDANGYPYDVGSVAAFAQYVAKGWYFVAFKLINDIETGFCSGLQPVMLSFPVANPVVPARIATAAAGEDAGNRPLLLWRIFGLTEGDRQINFAPITGASGLLGFSGAVGAADAAQLSGLAAEGDRLTKWTVTLASNLVDDLALALSPTADFHQVQLVVPTCPLDAAVDGPRESTPGPPDGSLIDAALAPDVASETGQEEQETSTPDVSTPAADAGAEGARPDGGVASEPNVEGGLPNDAATASDNSDSGCGCRIGRNDRAGARWGTLSLLAAALARIVARRRERRSA